MMHYLHSNTIFVRFGVSHPNESCCRCEVLEYAIVKEGHNEIGVFMSK